MLHTHPLILSHPICKIMRTLRHDFDGCDANMFTWIRDMCLSYPYTLELSSFQRCQTRYGVPNGTPKMCLETMFSVLEEELHPMLSNSSSLTRMDRCVQSLDILRYMHTQHRELYQLMLDIVYELHPVIKDFRMNIYGELYLMRQVFSMINNAMELICSNIYHHLLPSSNTKVDASRDECITFLKTYQSKLMDVPTFLSHHHRILFSSLPRHEDHLIDCLGACFQDIYFLETLVHSCDVRSLCNVSPSMLCCNHYSSVKLFQKLYQRMYDQIMDGETWTTLLTNKKGEPLLKTHPFLPHPEDFVYLERPWKNVLRKRGTKLGGSHILYASPPLPINRFMTRKLMSLL